MGALLIVLAALSPNLNTLHNAFVGDDVAIVGENPLILDVGGIPRLFRENYWAPIDRSNLYRPLTLASFALNRALTGRGPAGFHAGNLLLHAVASLLVWAVATQLLGAGLPATAAGILFAVHPIHCEAVAGVVGRADLMAAIGCLAAVLLHLRGGRLAMAGAGLAAAVAFLSKEIGLGLLPALLCLDVARKRAGEPVRLLPWLSPVAAALLYFFLRSRALLPEQLTAAPLLARIDNALVGEALGPRLLTAASVLARYLGLCLWPARLSADYSYAQIPIARSLTDPWALGGILSAVVLATLLVVGMVQGRRALVASLALFGGSYFIVSNTFVLIGALMAERLVYLPTAGLALAIATGLAAARLPAAPVVAAVSLIALALAGRTSVRNLDWRDQLTLFAANAAASPRSIRALVYHADELRQAGDVAAARRQVERAIAIDPGEAWSWNALSRVHGTRDLGRAREALETAIRLRPNYPEAHYNLAAIAIYTGQFEEAVVELRTALGARRYYPEAEAALAEAYLGLGRPGEARPYLEAALAAQPAKASNLLLVGRLRTLEQDREGALQAYREARRLDPSLAVPSLAIARQYQAAGGHEEALAAYRDAQAVPQPPLEAFVEAAVLLAHSGRLGEARREIDRAREKLGTSATIENHIGTIAVLGGDREAARAAWRRSLALDPTNAFARSRLAALDAEPTP